MKNLAFVFLCSFVLFGCSGKVQTNALPNQTKYHLPSNSNSTSHNNQILQCASEDYENYAREFFGKDRIVKQVPKPVKVRTQKELESRTIWRIGREKGYFDEKK